MNVRRSFIVCLIFFLFLSAFMTTSLRVNPFSFVQSLEDDKTELYSRRAEEQRVLLKANPYPSKGFVISDNPEPSTPVQSIPQIHEYDDHFPASSTFGTVIWMKDEAPYYEQDMSQWCWAASLTMLHQWWSPIQLGTSYQQQSEITQYIKGSVVNQPASADEIHRMLREWNNVDARYENFQLTYKGEGKLFNGDPPTGYTDDPKTWIHHVGSPVIAFVDTDTPMDGAANHAVLVIGYDDTLNGGSVFIHDPWFSNWWPGHSGESCSELTLTYAEFNVRWDVVYEGWWPFQKRHGMATGIPGDNKVAFVGYASLSFSGTINLNELERIEVGVGPSGDNSAPSYDSFGEYYEDGVLVELSDPSSGETSYAIGLGDFTSFSPNPPASYIYFATSAIPQDSARTGAYFHIKPNTLGTIWVNYKWWINDEDDRTHTLKETLEWITVLDDRGGDDTSHSMLKPTLIKDTHGPSSDSFDVLPSEITITETLNPSTSSPYGIVQVYGTATFDDGSSVSYTDVTITIIGTGASWTTATDSNGYYSHGISAPGSGGTYTVRVDISSGELSGWNSKTLIVQDLPGGDYYALYRTTTCKGVQGSTPYDPIDETEAFRTTDSVAYTWVHLINVYTSLNVKWEWYDPDGNYQTQCTTTIPDPGAGYYWEWYKCWCGIYIDGYTPQDMEGRWRSRVYIDEGTGYELQAIEDFVIRYEVTGRTMAKDVQTSDPYEPIDPTDSFLNTDLKALAWIRLDEIAESVEIKWEWHEPSDAIYSTYYWTTEDPAASGYLYWDWYKAWCYIDINGYPPQSKLGTWEVRAYIKDVYGNWDLEYSQYFTIADNTPPGPPGTPIDYGVYSTSGTVTWTWTAAPEDGEVAQYQMQVGTTPGGDDVFDGLVGTELSKTLTSLSDGLTYYARVRAMNTIDQWGPWSGVSDGITVDTMPPVTTIEHTPGSSSVSLSASDETSGVAVTYYRIDSDAWNTYSAPIILTGTETRVIDCYSRDNAGNNEPTQALVVHYLIVDTDPAGLDAPVGEGWYDFGTNASISVSPVPNHMFEYWYLDGQADIPYSTDMNTTVVMDNLHTVTANFLNERVHNINTELSYFTIQTAIDAPETLTGHTIFVEEGIYYENVIVNKSVTLIGQNSSLTIIDGNGTGSVLNVTRDNVEIKGFTIQNSGYGWPISGITFGNVTNCDVRENIITDNYYGIHLSSSSSNVIVENNITGNHFGIRLYFSSNNTISSNNITDNGSYGVQLYYSSSGIIIGNSITESNLGISLVASSSNTLSGNNITANISNGVCLSSSPNNTLSSNRITANLYSGIHLSSSSSNVIVGNNITATNYIGLQLLSSSNNNRFYHNNFVDNTNQVSIELGSSNAWDNGCEGNYWSNYTGADSDGDGIGDTSHVIDENNQDNCPLMNPYLLGDTNHDGTVDDFDVLELVETYGSKPGDGDWNCHCDFNGDNIVDASDLFDLSKNYGKSMLVYELYYDDGVAEGEYATSTLPHFKAVRFHAPIVGAYKLEYVKYHIASDPASFELQIRDSSAQIIYSEIVTPTEAGWFIVSFPSQNIYIEGDFYVAMKYLTAQQPKLGADYSDPDLESYEGTGFTPPPNLSSLDWMIRAGLGVLN